MFDDNEEEEEGKDIVVNMYWCFVRDKYGVLGVLFILFY